MSSFNLSSKASNVIVACHSTELSNNERDLFAQMQPWGIILFARNIENPTQVQKLIESIKVAMKRSELMVFIDQEGGRVSRLPSAFWRVPPAPTVFAQMYQSEPDIAKRACFLNAWLTGIELKASSINVNCAPMIDITQQDSATIISERALGNTTTAVIDLAREITKGLKRAGVAPVIKHMPGHGRATCDSHLELPKVDASIAELNAADFVPFKALNDESMAMSAHVLYSQIDANSPATASATLIKEVIRSSIGFDGLLMTDDINMKALSGSIATRANRAIEAGCDIALHCSGDFDEMKELSEVATELTDDALRRAQSAEKVAFHTPANTSAQDIEDELNSLLKRYS